MEKRNKLIIILLIVAIIGLIIGLKYFNKNNDVPTPQVPTKTSGTTDFDYVMIKDANSLFKNNYMISPVSIAYALSIASEGANNNTKSQFDKLLNNYKLVDKVNVKDRISIANGLFIRDTYKEKMKESFVNITKSKYNSDIIYDDFKTPDTVNNWVNDKTYKMIPELLDRINSDSQVIIANAIAIDVEWKQKFELEKTYKQEFTKIDNNKMYVNMMHSTDDITYIENSNAKGIIKDYAIYNKNTGEKTTEENNDTVSLEYIAILPNEGIDTYINKLNKDELNSLLSNKKTPTDNLEINLSLPKYEYKFTYEGFKDSLVKLGLEDAFTSGLADFSNMSSSALYISDAIHKSYIELSEEGTKAAAVTALIFKDTMLAPNEKEKINITFDKPFIYIIKEKNNDNIWFFGTVYEPTEFKK